MAKILTVVLLNILVVFSIHLLVDASNKTNVCTKIRGEVHKTVKMFNRSCTQNSHINVQSILNITWNDGSYSALLSDQTVEMTAVTNVWKVNGMGGISDGKYAGNNATNWSTFTDTSFGCLTGVGLSRLTGVAFVSIGTPGISEWVVCTGNASKIYSPTITAAPVDLVSKLTIDFDNCIGSCQ